MIIEPWVMIPAIVVSLIIIKICAFIYNKFYKKEETPSPKSSICSILQEVELTEIRYWRNTKVDEQNEQLLKYKKNVLDPQLTWDIVKGHWEYMK